MRALLIALSLMGAADAEPTLEEMRRVVDASRQKDPPPDDPGYVTAVKMQAHGAALMGAGIYHLVGLTISGYFGVGEAACGLRHNCSSWGVGMLAASTTFAIGALCTIIGIPLYIEGTTRLHKRSVRARVDLDGLRVTF